MSNSSYSYSSSSYSSSSYATFTSSSSSNGGRPFAQTYTSESHSNSRDGTQTRRTYQETGQPMVEERTHTDASGRRIEGYGGTRNTGGHMTGRIEDVTDREERSGVKGQIEEPDDNQAQRDREYEERMEDEYAKREGGA